MFIELKRRGNQEIEIQIVDHVHLSSSVTLLQVLLQNSKLGSLELQWIKSKDHVSIYSFLLFIDY